MKKFVVIYHVPKEAMAQMANVPAEEQAKGMEAWMNWAKKLGNQLTDMGMPLMNGQQLNPDGSSQESTKNVSGYSIIEANDMEEAKSMLEGHPHISGWNKDATVEVHEVMPLPGM